ncbi:gelsolin-like protein 2 [Strongylocentrotus purpuratus]|uniref:Gelsolin-like domain-containing protein n=1 Tax=Strongylocentrotus purpuratus TaxID=7668 RepID=A0A7M7HMP8_STRPU|nr:gelsolin-like protein 2 [Strongylocentrotus purpuratus]|eukprot:XP_011674669.1 PREDICTED: gelsolin-like protein 2 [Strongylocentrotus purpuratus]
MAEVPVRGLRKAKEYDWKDSNLALFGSDVEKNIKKESAKTEPAWENAGSKVGLEIWRIVKFKVKRWPKEEKGSFFSGDSYIILNTYKKPDSKSEELLYDVHFWIGKHSTQDEYGTAAYKTVELDHFLDDKPVQHREVMDYESDLFKTYFDTITLMEGGADSGFRHVDPKKYEPRLLHFKGDRKRVNLHERPMSRKSLKSGDVFILDLGLKLYQWNGSKSNKDERTKAVQYLSQLKEIRGKAKSETVDENRLSDAHPFFTHLPDVPVDEVDCVPVDNSLPTMFRLQNTGQLTFTKVAEGIPLKKEKLDSNDVFIVDTRKDCFVWIGKGADQVERRNAFGYAHNYLMKCPHPFIPITAIQEGQTNAAFEAALA